MLKFDLAQHGVNRFHIFRNNGENIQTNCPFHKNGQERKPSFGVNGEIDKCHCFQADTKVITRSGIKSISSLCDKTVDIINGNGDWETVIFRNYGKQRLMKLTLTANEKEQIIYTTPEHEWIVKNRKNKIQTKDLKNWMYLDKILPKVNEELIPSIDGIVHGFCYGDGCMTGHHRQYQYKCFFYNKSDLGISKYFEHLGNIKKSIAGNGKEYDSICFSSYRDLKKVPDMNLETDEYLLGFLAGYFVADGNESNGGLSLYSAKKEDILKIRDIFVHLGIATFNIGTSNIKAGNRGCLIVKNDTNAYTLRIVKNNVPKSFFITAKGIKNKSSYDGRLRHRVVSVEYTDRYEDVYCCQTSTHSFALDGYILTGNCFACGWSGTIEEMVSELYGYKDEGKFGKRWLIKRFNTVEIETRQNIMEGFNGRNIKNDILGGRCSSNICDRISNNSATFISDEELDKYRYIHPYMYERGLTDEIIERFDIGYDRERKEITFPVRDIEGRCVFVAGRSVERKFFRLPKGIDKPIYCADKFRAGAYRTAYITESFLNCLTCWKYNKPAMAMIGTGNQKQYEILNKLPVREYILAFDPDEAGRKATERFRKNVHGKIIKELVYPDNRDINDLQEEFLNCKIIF
jgi:hypothetical protein